ncbi:hypothetical protein QWY84_10440 [Aquisalimonas lutea]|uniref:hypothetical protein n=1 Tax=Aquisalimonas lutea TaxID=1327750 RepID=UPI0025B2F4B5|nr:hypothetical protein [Aquisalimonas lutea]MDN3518027.1 hypothetical protein [Aquisalimonas lutea]
MGTTQTQWRWLPFQAAAVRALVEHARGCEQREPTPDQMLEPRFRRVGAPRPARGMPPPREDLALDKVPPALHLVAGDGLFLRSNGIAGQAPQPLFADGCDPSVDDGWRSAVTACAGVEEQVLALPAGAVAEVLEEAGEQVWLGVCRDEEAFAVEEYALAAEPAEPE